jgi:small redox-active disulfide protein 2
MNIKVLGTGCANCKATLRIIEQVAAEKHLGIELEKVEDLPTIMSYGIVSTPGVVIDGKVVHSGGVPERRMVENWLVAPAA